jgi:hypothetical protein
MYVCKGLARIHWALQDLLCLLLDLLRDPKYEGIIIIIIIIIAVVFILDVGLHIVLCRSSIISLILMGIIIIIIIIINQL